MTLSVIIPALNEEENLKKCIESAAKLNPLEIIVVDGGSYDNTVEIARQEGIITLRSQKGRGVQMNAGALIARGEVFMFLHADSILASEVSSSIINQAFDEGRIGGFFRLTFDDNSISTKLVELFANFRARFFALPYGDQAIFIRKETFQKIGGFREFPFLEDLDMSLRLKKHGKLKYIPLPVIASARRINKGFPLSPIIVSVRNFFIAWLFVLGISPFALARWYK
jgi:rSAM/selenodomain-associated transferase 2